MTDNREIKIGTVVKPHGVRGAFSVYSDVTSLNQIPDFLHVISHSEKSHVAIPLVLSVKNMKQLPDGRIVFETQEISSRDEAEKLRGFDVYISLNFMDTLSEDEILYDDLINMTVVSEGGEHLGVIVRFMKSPAPYPLAVLDDSGKEILCPLPPQHFLDFDLKSKIATISDDMFFSIRSLNID
ncbi:MAG: 16S rRNA processing protein RimM [Deltaproteobacteria bacterium]|nr:16S rRNA processing protein RimM [Deltaproteobacteria bacterium]